MIVSLPAEASRIAPQAPRGRGGARHARDGGQVAEAERAQVRQRQAADRAREVAERVGARVAVGRGVGRAAAADAVGDENDGALKRGHAMSLHRHPTHYHGNVNNMALARSRLTAQGQISVPAEVRRKLGLGPGSVLEWDEEDGKVVVRRVGRYTSDEMHKALFPTSRSRVAGIVERETGRA